MNAGDSTVAVIGKSVQIRGEVRGSEDLMVDGPCVRERIGKRCDPAGPAERQCFRHRPG
jgi:hypothetical protein